MKLEGLPHSLSMPEDNGPYLFQITDKQYSVNCVPHDKSTRSRFRLTPWGKFLTLRVKPNRRQ